MHNVAFSVVMVSYYTGGVLIRSVINALKMQGIKELILVNNGNVRFINEILHDLALVKDKLKIINNPSNIGYAAAANQAVKQCTSDYVLFMSPDCQLATNEITADLVAQLRKHEAQVAGIKTIGTNGLEMPSSRRNILNPFNGFMSWLGFKSSFNIGGKNVPSKPKQIKALSSRFMFVDAKYFKKLGGFDEKFFLYFEDADFFRRVKKDGGKVMYFSGHKVLHLDSTSNASQDFINTFKMQSLSYYFRRHYIWAWPFAWFASNFYHLFKIKIKAEKRNEIFREDCLKTALEYSHVAFLTDKLKYYQPKAVMVVGATNQVGIAVLRLLLKMNCKIIATYRTEKPDFDHENIEWRHYDLKSEDHKLDVSNCDGVICTSYLPSVVMQADRFGLGKVRSAVFTSCVAPSSKLNRYLTAKDKRKIDEISQSEEIILEAYKESSTNCCIIKPTMIYGYGIDQNIELARKFIEGNTYFPVDENESGIRQPIYVEDVATALITALHTSDVNQKVIKIGGAEKIDFKKFIMMIFLRVGFRPDLKEVPLMGFARKFPSIFSAGRVGNKAALRSCLDYEVDNSEAKKSLGSRSKNFRV